jgi:hypothetical protein
MAGAHATGGIVLVVVSAAFALGALLSIRFQSWQRALTGAGHALVVLLAVEILIGGLVYVQGRRPTEPLHFLYAVVALGALPAARGFASEAPPRSRAGVMALAGVLLCTMIWRLFATGGTA